MTQENNLYKADEGKLIVRKEDNFIMGDAIDLGSADSIENYEERLVSDEELAKFKEMAGVHEEHTAEKPQPRNRNRKRREK